MLMGQIQAKSRKGSSAWAHVMRSRVRAWYHLPFLGYHGSLGPLASFINKVISAELLAGRWTGSQRAVNPGGHLRAGPRASSQPAEGTTDNLV